ncbi:MAG: Hpt domain-containing protein, partial [Alphaproteobacteria bacterium]|nr:Hpt domain-containing protein [Alphaproteobacteria bacterium]
INPYELMASVSHWLGDVSDVAPREERLRAEAERSAEKKAAGTSAPAPEVAGDSNDDAVFDPAGIAQLTKDYGETVAREVVDNFHNISAGLIDDLLGAAQSGDMSLWHRAAHDLKGGARTLGLKRLADVCRDIEFACGNNQAEVARQGTDGLGQIFNEALAALAEYRGAG